MTSATDPDSIAFPNAGPVPPAAIPPRAGIGMRAPHYREIVEQCPAVHWLEVHPENFMGGGGPSLDWLLRARQHYPVSLHGVGLSLGGAEPPDPAHLRRLKDLVDRVEPGLISEHVAWVGLDGVYLNDLLPIPYTPEALDRLCDNIDLIQESLGRRILIENPSAYLRFTVSSMAEPAFLAEAVRRTGCGLLLDVNNIYVSGRNLGFSPDAYVDGVPAAAVAEIHLAGHAVNRVEAPDGSRHDLRIDDHGSAVCADVWALFERCVQRTGPVPTLIERDTNIPPLAELVAEAERADRILNPLLSPAPISSAPISSGPISPAPASTGP